MPKTKKNNLIENPEEEYDIIEVEDDESLDGQEIGEDGLIDNRGYAEVAENNSEALEDMGTTSFRNQYENLQTQIQEDCFNDHFLTKKELCTYLEQLQILENVRLGERTDYNSCKQWADSLKSSIIRHSEYPSFYIKDVVNNIRTASNIYEAVDKAEKAYFKDVPEEDRFKETQHGKDYSDMVIGEHDIIAEADAINNELNGLVGTIDDPGDIKKNIELYHKLCQANEQRGFFSKAWSAIKGIFGAKTEDKLLAQMKKNILEKSNYPDYIMEKAFNAKSEDHLDHILDSASMRGLTKDDVAPQKEAQDGPTRETLDISNKEVGTTELDVDEYTNDDLDLSNEPQKSYGELEMD